MRVNEQTYSDLVKNVKKCVSVSALGGGVRGVGVGGGGVVGDTALVDFFQC